MTEESKRTMKEMSHTNPYTGESAGQLFRRGPVIAADGGRRGAADEDAPEAEAEAEDDAEDADADQMKDVSHTPPNESEDANRVFERGGKERAVEE